MKTSLAELISIGDEILVGKTLDTNSNWLCKELIELGISVNQITIIHDNETQIYKKVSHALNVDNPVNLVITTGGLGPTDDDITLKVISKVVGEKLVLNKEALEMVSRRYRELVENGKLSFSDMTLTRKKMAMLPKSSIPIYNTIGAAPSILIKRNNKILLCLPGPPKEMQECFHRATPLFIDLIGKREKTLIEELEIKGILDESLLTPTIRVITKNIPNVFIKPRPNTHNRNRKSKIRVVVSGNRNTQKKRLNRTLKQLRESLHSSKITINK